MTHLALYGLDSRTERHIFDSIHQNGPENMYPERTMKNNTSIAKKSGKGLATYLTD